MENADKALLTPKKKKKKKNSGGEKQVTKKELNRQEKSAEGKAVPGEGVRSSSASVSPSQRGEFGFEKSRFWGWEMVMRVLISLDVVGTVKEVGGDNFGGEAEIYGNKGN